MIGRRDRRRPALSTIVRRAVAEDALFTSADTILCACSGGPDSTALLHVLAHLRSAIGHRLVACAVDHGLRDAAAAEIAGVEAIARELDVPLDVVTLRVARGGNLQARARAARRQALDEVARRRGATLVATGHTADDRAETLLLRLMRGAGPRGLAVLPPRDGAFVRPILRARRSDVMAHLARHGLEAASDPSNRDRAFARTRVREDLLPLLVELSPRIVESLCALADALGPMRDDADPLARLGRDQRAALERARKLGRSTARLRITGGRDLIATFQVPASDIASPGGPSPPAASLAVDPVVRAGRPRR